MKLEARFKEVRRRKGLAESTEEAYWMWAKDFINYWRDRENRWVYPDEWDESHVENFLTHLAVDRNVSAIAFAGQKSIRKSTVEGVRKAEITEDGMGVKKGDLSFRHSITIGKSVVSLVGIEKTRVRVRVESDDLISFVPVDDVAKPGVKSDTDAVTT